MLLHKGHGIIANEKTCHYTWKNKKLNAMDFFELTSQNTREE